MLFSRIAAPLVLAASTLVGAQDSFSGSKGDYLLDVEGMDPTPQPRLEIYDLKNNYPLVYSMFVQGLAQFMSMYYKEKYSFHNIAALHGMPFGVDSETMNTECENPQYCQFGYAAHHTPAFLPWHRAYLALYEQEIRKHAVEAASSLPQRYKDAAQRVRLPYWDWARYPEQGETVFPTFFTTDNIDITMPDPDSPDDESKDNPNFSYLSPFLQYNFPEDQTLNYSYTSGNGALYYKNTVRWPAASNASEGTADRFVSKSNNDNAISEFAKLIENYRNSLYMTFGSIVQPWNMLKWVTMNPLGTDRRALPKTLWEGKWLTIEDVHNNVHLSVGGSTPGELGGTMTLIKPSSFDPMFWMHHCQVDRIYTIYQLAYPANSISDSPASDSSWWMPQYTTVGMKTVLRPFKTTTGQDVTVENTWNTKMLGYFYQDGEDASSPFELQANTAKKYGPQDQTPGFVNNNATAPSSTPSPNSNPKAKRSPSFHPSESREIYAAFVQIDASKFKGVAMAYVFDGSAHNDTAPSQWKHMSNLLGRTSFNTHGGGLKQAQMAIDINKLNVPKYHTMHLHPHLAATATARLWVMTQNDELKVYDPAEIEGCQVNIVSIERLENNMLGKTTLIKHIGHGNQPERALVGQKLVI